MKICERGLNWVQVIDETGEVNLCSWRKKSRIGNILEHSFYDVYHSEEANAAREELIKGDYTHCWDENCPYLSNHDIEKHRVEISQIPEYPDTLSLSYEGKCNYHCTCCSSHSHMKMCRERDWSKNYLKIESEIRKVLPHIKRISAHGTGELFASPSVMKMLGEWRPLAPVHECSVELETNGSLFNEKNWEKISNLGQYDVSVYITVMSFEEQTYRYLSGTSLPVENIINNLHYVRSLREKGIINHVEIGTVVQERNFREMPSFVSRCINEFAADTVRLRSVFVFKHAPMDHNVAWFSDVRNPYHPYHQEYLDIMRDPIFTHPKVYRWSGNLESSLGEHPGIQAEQQVHVLKNKCDNLLIRCMLPRLKGRNIVIYGAGFVGRLVAQALLKDKSLYGEICFAETKKTFDEKCGLPVYELKELAGKDAVVVIAVREKHRAAMIELAKSLGFQDIVAEEF